MFSRMNGNGINHMTSIGNLYFLNYPLQHALAEKMGYINPEHLLNQIYPPQFTTDGDN